MNYLYNDIEAPPLPNEITVHPYLFVMSVGTAYYAFGCAVKPHTWVDDTITKPLRYGTDEVVPMRQAIGVPWTLYPETEGKLQVIIGGSGSAASNSAHGNKKVHWTNHDIYNPDGTLLLAASYPINQETGKEVTEYGLNPVSHLNPSALMQGFMVGMSIK